MSKNEEPTDRPKRWFESAVKGLADLSIEKAIEWAGRILTGAAAAAYAAYKLTRAHTWLAADSHARWWMIVGAPLLGSLAYLWVVWRLIRCRRGRAAIATENEKLAAMNDELAAENEQLLEMFNQFKFAAGWTSLRKEALRILAQKEGEQDQWASVDDLLDRICAADPGIDAAYTRPELVDDMEAATQAGFVLCVDGRYKITAPGRRLYLERRNTVVISDETVKKIVLQLLTEAGKERWKEEMRRDLTRGSMNLKTRR